MVELASNGTLRVALNASNSILARPLADGEWGGIAPELARLLAARLRSTCEFVAYPLPTDIAADDGWDIAMIAIDPGRLANFAFSSPYCEIEATLLVRAGCAAGSWRELDVPGQTIAAPRGSAFGLWLERHIEQAELRLVPGATETFQVFVDEGLDAFAGLRPALDGARRRVPGSRLLPGAFTAIQQGIAVRTPPRRGVLPYLHSFVQAVLRSGAIDTLVAGNPAPGLFPAPHQLITNGVTPPT